tara:strand:+ start:84 stop:371 length:288 start_codon:yes stop_codon:yes gene_type:complete
MKTSKNKFILNIVLLLILIGLIYSIVNSRYLEGMKNKKKRKEIDFGKKIGYDDPLLLKNMKDRDNIMNKINNKEPIIDKEKKKRFDEIYKETYIV